MKTNDNASKELYDLLVTQGMEPKTFDKSGRPTEDEELSTMFTFDFTVDGHNYGSIVILLSSEGKLEVFAPDTIGRQMDAIEREKWFDFLGMLKYFARKSRREFQRPQPMNRLKGRMRNMATLKESLAESYYGNRKTSYNGQPKEARLMIKHNRDINEGDARYRYIESLFVETADGERFKLKTKKLSAGRAMLEHVKHGGTPYDLFGQHINEMAEEMNTLSRFLRVNRNALNEEATAMFEAAGQHYSSLRKTMKSLGSSRGYERYTESWQPLDETGREGLVEEIRDLFVEQRIDPRIEEALPVLAHIMERENSMKEVNEFEAWADKLTEGTWAIPDTPESEAKLKELMSQPLIAGPNGDNAKNELYDIVGDDQLADIISDIADHDANTNVWEHPEVISRLEELGIDTSAIQQQQDQDADQDQEADVNADEQGFEESGMYEADNMSTFEEDVVESLRRKAGLTEAVLTDSTGETFDHVLDRFPYEVAQFKESGELDDSLYDALYDYYVSHGEMPYGVAKARTGDPFNWVSEKLQQDLGVEESSVAPVDFAAETSCNMTHEGQMCPVHGLTECGTVAGGVAVAPSPAAASTTLESDLQRILALSR